MRFERKAENIVERTELALKRITKENQSVQYIWKYFNPHECQRFSSTIQVESKEFPVHRAIFKECPRTRYLVVMPMWRSVRHPFNEKKDIQTRKGGRTGTKMSSNSVATSPRRRLR